MAVANTIAESVDGNIAAKVVDSYNYTLCSSIGDPAVFGSLLMEKEFLTGQIVNNICHTLGVPDYNKIMKLLSAVVNRIKTSGTADDCEKMFYRFVGDVLKNALQLVHVAEPMEDKYREC